MAVRGFKSLKIGENFFRIPLCFLENRGLPNPRNGNAKKGEIFSK